MRPFAYVRVADRAAAIAAVREQPGARFVAGGTNLVDLMKLGVETPTALVDLSGIGLETIEVRPDGGLLIGAGVRNNDLAVHPVVRRDLPVLTQALLAGASGQLRNAATVGGNLLQRTRCPYFQDVTKRCNKRVPGSGCPARAGDHRNHAILGASDACVATNPSDMAVALAALDAIVHYEDGVGARTVPLTEFHRLPGDEPERDTVLPPDALVTAVEVPPLRFGRSSAYRKVRDRASYAFAITSVAAAVAVDGDRVSDVRLAIGAVAHKPWRATRAEELLRGAQATEESFRTAVDAELAAARPLPRNGFKVALVRNVVVGMLADLSAQHRA
jgi:xanthine dehydrogenase YagS FAD-binding subunit